MKLNSACLAVLLPIAAAADYRCVDLRTKVTTGFSDSVANDYMGGWFDEGRNDLRTFPVGKRTFAGVVFDVIDPDGNGGASCIALRSSNRPYFPLEVKGIALPSGKWDRIHVLQSAAWGDDKLHGEPVIDYVLTYRDGTRAFLPMRFMRDVGNWWVPKDLPTASLAWAGYNPVGRLVGVWRKAVENPHPEKELRSLDIVSRNTTAVVGVIAVTLQRGREEPSREGRTVRLKAARDAQDYVMIPADATEAKGVEDEKKLAIRKRIDAVARQRDEYRMANTLLAYGLGRSLKSTRYSSVGQVEAVEAFLASVRQMDVPMRPAFGGELKEGTLFWTTVCESLPKKIVLPAYPSAYYRVLDEKACRAEGWRIFPTAWLHVVREAQAEAVGTAAAILRKGDETRLWANWDQVRHLRGVWTDSFTRKPSRDDPRQQEKSDAGRDFVAFMELNEASAGDFAQLATDFAGELACCEREYAWETNAFARLMAQYPPHPAAAHRPKVTVRDGMFLVDGKPKIMWGTEIGGIVGQGANGITSPLGKMYLGSALDLFGFDYATFTLYPVLDEFRGVVNPRRLHQRRADGKVRDERAEVRQTVRALADRPWALEMNAVFFTYNEFFREVQGVDVKHGSNFSLFACPEEPSTWWAMEKLYRECLDDTLGQGANIQLVELDNESLYISYSPTNRVAFPRWLQAKYGTVAALNARWGRAHRSFAEIEPPRLDAQSAVAVGLAPSVDWIKFQQEQYTSAIARKREMVERLLGTNRVLFSIQPFATVSGGDHRHSYATRGCDLEAVARLVDVLSTERIFTPWTDVSSPEAMPLAIGNAGYMFTALLSSIAEKGRQPLVNTEGAMVKYGGKKTADEYRLGVWSHVIHGDQAIVPTYWGFYPAADSVNHPANNEFDVLPAMCEIGRSFRRYGELLAPVPRIRGTTALFVSFETLRDLRRPFSPEKEFYAGTFSRRSLELVTSAQILEGRLSRYRALMLSAAHLVDPAVFAKIRAWVRDGGIALASPETFLGDEYGAPIRDADGFFPCARDFSRIDTFEAGRAADAADIAHGVYGRGHVYQFRATPTARRMLEAWKAILTENGLVQEVEVFGEEADHFIEAQVVRRADGLILFLGNYQSKAAAVTIPMAGALPCGGETPISLLDGRSVSVDEDRLRLTVPPHGCEVLWFRQIRK